MYSMNHTDTSNELSPKVMNFYKEAARIAKTCIEALKARINDGETDVKKLCVLGNDMVIEMTNSVHKSLMNKGIGFPTCISLNNCTGPYVFEDDMPEYNTIKVGDVIKLEVGVQLNGYCALYGETIVKSDNIKCDEHDNALRLLNTLKSHIPKHMKNGACTDDVKQYIESTCTEYGLFPVENSVLKQQLKDNVSFDLKTCILNNVKYYDDDGMDVSPPNFNYDVEVNDVYDVSIKVVKEADPSTSFTQKHKPHVYRYNDFFYNLKLKSSRIFCKMVKDKHFNYPFDFTIYSDDARNRMGLKESLDNGIIEKYEVNYEKSNKPVYAIRFTLLVGEKKSYVL